MPALLPRQLISTLPSAISHTVAEGETDITAASQHTDSSAGEINSSSPDGFLTWRVWSARRRPVAATAAAVFVVALAVGVHFSFDSPMYPVLTVLVLSSALCPYYLPTRFTLDGEGITINSLLGCRKKLWSRLAAYFPNGDDGVLVGLLPRGNLLSATRGIYLAYKDNREVVLAYLAQHLAQGQVKSDQ